MPDPQFYILFSLSIAVLGICTSDGVPLTYFPLAFASILGQYFNPDRALKWGDIFHIRLFLFVPTVIISLYAALRE